MIFKFLDCFGLGFTHRLYNWSKRLEPLGNLSVNATLARPSQSALERGIEDHVMFCWADFNFQTYILSPRSVLETSAMFTKVNNWVLWNHCWLVNIVQRKTGGMLFLFLSCGCVFANGVRQTYFSNLTAISRHPVETWPLSGENWLILDNWSFNPYTYTPLEI